MKSNLTRYITLILTILLSVILSPLQAKENESHTVVIDAGHGGKDVGAVDNGAQEKAINLGVAKKIAELLKKDKEFNIVMTRDDDTFISLQERAEIANKAKGDLFVSIHTNSLDKSNKNRKTAEGTSVYVLGLHKDQNNMKVARRENSVIELESNYTQKYSGFDPSKDESYIIFEMAQKSNLSHSFKFANEAQQNLVKTASRKDRGVKQAGFWVLWATSMPAVLVELDFICNPTSAKYMTSEKGQSELAQALYDAIKNYFKSIRLAQGTPELKSVKEPPKTDTPSAPVASNNAMAKRRRRSETAKNTSDQRDLSTAEIPIHSEEERLPVIVEEEIAIAEAPTVVTEEPKNRKEKKSRKKEKSADNKKDSQSKKKNTKLVTIADGGHKSTSGIKPKAEKIVTVYKIQILVSEERLKTNNPRFCGLSPITAIKEKNMYKYTYGESEDRKEIEALLKKVKEKIPDAFIITSKK